MLASVIPPLSPSPVGLGIGAAYAAAYAAAVSLAVLVTPTYGSPNFNGSHDLSTPSPTHAITAVLPTHDALATPAASLDAARLRGLGIPAMPEAAHGSLAAAAYATLSAAAAAQDVADIERAKAHAITAVAGAQASALNATLSANDTVQAVERALSTVDKTSRVDAHLTIARVAAEAAQASLDAVEAAQVARSAAAEAAHRAYVSGPVCVEAASRAATSAALVADAAGRASRAATEHVLLTERVLYTTQVPLQHQFLHHP